MSSTAEDRREEGVEFTPSRRCGEPIEDEDAFLRDIGIDPSDITEVESPP